MDVDQRVEIQPIVNTRSRRNERSSLAFARLDIELAGHDLPVASVAADHFAAFARFRSPHATLRDLS